MLAGLRDGTANLVASDLLLFRFDKTELSPFSCNVHVIQCFLCLAVAYVIYCNVYGCKMTFVINKIYFLILVQNIDCGYLFEQRQ